MLLNLARVHPETLFFSKQPPSEEIFLWGL